MIPWFWPYTLRYFYTLISNSKFPYTRRIINPETGEREPQLPIDWMGLTILVRKNKQPDKLQNITVLERNPHGVAGYFHDVCCHPIRAWVGASFFRPAYLLIRIDSHYNCKSYYIMNVHLVPGYRNYNREEQIAEIQDIWKYYTISGGAGSGDKYIMLGDFNTAPDQPELRGLIYNNLAWSDLTALQQQWWPTLTMNNPWYRMNTHPDQDDEDGTRVDYIWVVPAQWKSIARVKRILDKSPWLISDHYGLSVKLYT